MLLFFDANIRLYFEIKEIGIVNKSKKDEIIIFSVLPNKC